MQSKPCFPQLAILITDNCNYKCYYCNLPEFSTSKSRDNLTFQEIVRLLSIAYAKGFRVFRLTGGEPTLRPDLTKIIHAINNFGNDTTILLGTNGALLGDFIGDFVGINNLKIFVGLDLVKRKHVGFPKSMTDTLLDNLSVLSKSNFVRINMLVMKSNKEDVWKMIDICSSLKIDLKLHDLFYSKSIISPDCTSEDFFYKEYCNVSDLIPRLSCLAAKISNYPENASDCGVPMTCYKIKNINVIIKDSFKGSYYAPSCSSCHIYPCLHGLYCPSISFDGTLQPSNCSNKQFQRKIASKTVEEVEESIDFVVSILNNSKFESIDKSLLNVKNETQTVNLSSVRP